MRARASRAWASIKEPRALTLLQALIYALCAAGGLATVAYPPSSVEGVYGTLITATWGWIALIGGLAGVISCPRGVWLIEKPAAILCGTAVVLYAGIILSLHVTQAGSRLPQFFFVSIALVHFIHRYVRIRRYAYDPEK